jgi:hypothetical protein
MPCYDGRDRPEEVRKEALAEFRHNSPVAEMLCGLITVLQAEKRTIPDIPGLAAWWIEHRRRDAIRSSGSREFWDSLFQCRVALIEAIQKQDDEWMIHVELLQDAGRIPPIGPMARSPFVGRFGPSAGAQVITSDKWLEPIRPIYDRVPS